MERHAEEAEQVLRSSPRRRRLFNEPANVTFDLENEDNDVTLAGNKITYIKFILFSGLFFTYFSLLDNNLL